jgi:hypothetical protein
MIGKNFWEDMQIDSVIIDEQVKLIAKELVDHHGKDLTEGDLLKMNAFSDSMAEPIQTAIVREAAEYYKTCDYNPEWIHSDMSTRTTEKKSFWKKLKKHFTLF